MVVTDKSDFSILMANCFQNFRAQVSKNIIEEWFEELKGFDFFHVRNAFKHYVRENEKFPPTLATMIRLSKREKVEKTKAGGVNRRQCYVKWCAENADEWRHENIWMCREHSEDMFIKMRPNSREALEAIKNKGEIEKWIESGMGGNEYFKKTNPKGYEKFKKTMNSVILQESAS